MPNPTDPVDTVERALELFEAGKVSRRQAAGMAVSAALGLAGLGAARTAGAQEASEPLFRTVEINHVALRVTDLDRSEAFYRDTLGLTTLQGGSFNRFMACGRDFVGLFRGERGGLDHVGFGWPQYDQAEAARRLESAGIEPVTQQNRIYFDDPDGTQLQLSWDEDWPGRDPRPGE